MQYWQYLWRLQKRRQNIKKYPYLKESEEKFLRKPDFNKIENKTVNHTELQKRAINSILNNRDKTHLLFGVTGSGKTEVYMSVIEKITRFANDCCFEIVGLEHSPVKGPEGNIEYLMYIRKADEKQNSEEVIATASELVKRSHDVLG